MKNNYLHLTLGVLITLLWACLLISQTAWAQAIPDAQWARVGHTLDITTDGNIVTAEALSFPPTYPGSLGQFGDQLVKYSLRGDQIWSTGLISGGDYIGGQIPGFNYQSIARITASAPSTNGGLIVTGGLNLNVGGALVRISADGTKGVFGSHDPTRLGMIDFAGVSETSFVALYQQDDQGRTATIIRKYDAGNLLWTRQLIFPDVNYPDPNPPGFIHGITRGNVIINTPDGGYLVAGYYNSNTNRPVVAWAAKLDGNGNITWQRFVSPPALTNPPGPNDVFPTYITDAIVSADGTGYALVGPGTIYPHSNATVLVEIDGNGNDKPSRVKAIDTQQASNAYITPYTGSNGKKYYAVGNTSQQGRLDPQLLLVDPANLSVVATRAFPGPGASSLTDIATAGDGSLVFVTSNNQLVKLQPEAAPPTPPTGGPLALLAPTYDCVTGAITFNTSGGNGSPIEYQAPGITGWTTNPNQFVDKDSRTANDVQPFTLMARQNGVTVSYVWDLRAYCNGTPPPPVTPPPTGGSLALIAPTYNCATGAFTFNTTGGNGSPIIYFAPGITGPTTNPNQFVDAGLRQAADAKPLSLSATQSGVTATYVFDLRATCPVGTNPPVQTNPDRAILVDLYNSTNGPGWTNKTNWLQGDSPCNWFGISCNSNGRVTGVRFTSNNLNGTLPASLGNLSQLKSLDFFMEPLLSGSIPTSLGNLSQLETLSIEYTKLSGSIPASLGNLSQLTSLFLASNQLSGPIPASLGRLAQLEHLYLFGNKLTNCIPAELASLCGKDVRLASGANPDSYFTTFCSNGTGACSTTPTTGLALIAPTYNCTTGAFTFNTTGGNGSPIIYFAPGITGPTTNPNQFVDAGLRQSADAKPISLSATQSGVTATYVFDLRATCPIGPNPPVQTNPDRAALVDLYNSTNGPGWTNKTNWLQGDSPCNWFGISCNSNGRVTGVRFTSNNLNGTLPASLGNLSQLKSLDFFMEPLLSGSIPTSLGNLSQLETLSIEYTKLSGSIPASLGNLSQLTSLFLASNQLSGPIPASLGRLAQLEHLYLFGNKLTNCIPAELASLCGKDVLLSSGAKPDSYFTTFCSNGTGACSTTPTTGLALIAPTYNCTTGAITFNTTGSNGTLIEYQAAGITGWTTNPNQFVDKDSRTANDVQPFTLMARQSGVLVTYMWNLKAACGRARSAALPEPGTQLRVRVLGNPVLNQTAEVDITGAEHQVLHLNLVDLQGRVLHQQCIDQAETIQRVRVPMGEQPGLFLLNVSTPTQHQQLKVVKP
jgi:Leucine-rich repeat (LRR) protein